MLVNDIITHLQGVQPMPRAIQPRICRWPREACLERHRYLFSGPYLSLPPTRQYWKFNAFQNDTLNVPLLFLLLFCSHTFFGLNAFLISGIKPLLRTLVRKYPEGKGPVADSICGSTTWGRRLLLSLLGSQQDREQ